MQKTSHLSAADRVYLTDEQAKTGYNRLKARSSEREKIRPYNYDTKSTYVLPETEILNEQPIILNMFALMGILFMKVYIKNQ